MIIKDHKKIKTKNISYINRLFFSKIFKRYNIIIIFTLILGLILGEITYRNALVSRLIIKPINHIGHYIVNTFDQKFSSHIKAEKIKIDIKHEDYQILSYDRYVALNRGRLLSDQRNEVPASIMYNNEKYDIKIRLKGHGWDHWNEEKKWSFRIKVKNNKTIFGMNEFSISHPKTRGYLNEYLFHKLLIKDQ